jgi:hypothetical protein
VGLTSAAMANRTVNAYMHGWMHHALCSLSPFYSLAADCFTSFLFLFCSLTVERCCWLGTACKQRPRVTLGKSSTR